MTSPVGALLIEVDQTFILDTRDGTLITDSDGKPLSTGFKMVREHDKYKALLGDGNARVSVGFDENISGPYGSYSAVKLRVNLTITCDQSRDTIQKAQEMVFDECVAFSDEAIKKAHAVLITHLGTLYPSKDEG